MYAQEAMAAEAAAANAPRHAEVDVEDLLDDPELEQLHRDRLLELQREAERRAVMQQKGHGEYAVRCCDTALLLTVLACVEGKRKLAVQYSPGTATDRLSDATKTTHGGKDLYASVNWTAASFS